MVAIQLTARSRVTISLHLFEPEFSLAWSKHPATGSVSWPRRMQSTTFQNIPSIFNTGFPSIPKSSRRYVSFRFVYQNSAFISLLFHACHVSRQSDLRWLDNVYNVWRAAIAAKLFTIQFSRASCSNLSLRYTHSRDHRVLHCPQCLFFLMSETKPKIHTKQE
jgi:hypothetical protein